MSDWERNEVKDETLAKQIEEAEAARDQMPDQYNKGFEAAKRIYNHRDNAVDELTALTTLCEQIKKAGESLVHGRDVWRTESLLKAANLHKGWMRNALKEIQEWNQPGRLSESDEKWLRALLTGALRWAE